MADHGILMKGDMVRAYLEGRKWMTRRTRNLNAINKNPNDWDLKTVSEKGAFFISKSIPQLTAWSKLPYGWGGDQLWFKETYALLCKEYPCECEGSDLSGSDFDAAHYVEYRADTGNAYPGDWPEEEAKGNDEAPKWKSSMFMPRKYSRITVPVVNVRVERVNDISEADAIAEGTTPSIVGDDLDYLKYRAGFQTLWDSINAKRGMSFEFNPWVWVYEFPKYSKLEVNTVCSIDGYDMAKG